MNRRAGFTLIEVLAVVALLALMVGAVRWTMADGQRAAVLDDAIDRVRFADRQSRAIARRFDRAVRLIVDLDAQTIRRSDSETDDRAAAPNPPTALPAAFRMIRVRTEDATIDHGAVAITLHPRGTSETYAIQITPAPGNQTPGSMGPVGVWLLVGGMSGQFTRVDDERTIQDIFAVLRPHAD